MDDLISRQAIMKLKRHNLVEGQFVSLYDIENLPSVRPQEPITEQWQELKETIIEMRDNDGTGTQQEVCKFLVNYMEVLEKQMVEQEPKTGHWIDVDGDNAICGCCNRLNHLYGTYCKHCGARILIHRKGAIRNETDNYNSKR